MAKYLYNGVDLPALPEYDQETYPYAVIGKHTYTDGVGYFFLANNEPFTAYEENTTKYGSIPFLVSASVMFKITESQNEWESVGTVGLQLEYVWSNHDLYGYNDATVIVYKASDPVPVLTLTARDLYRKINGKPTKLTLYKKLGGKLNPLDEHTKEVKT